MKTEYRIEWRKPSETEWRPALGRIHERDEGFTTLAQMRSDWPSNEYRLIQVRTVETVIDG